MNAQHFVQLARQNGYESDTDGEAVWFWLKQGWPHKMKLAEALDIDPELIHQDIRNKMLCIVLPD